MGECALSESREADGEDAEMSSCLGEVETWLNQAIDWQSCTKGAKIFTMS